MSSYTNSESKKEEFQKYLERAGVIDALTKGASTRRRRCARPSERPNPFTAVLLQPTMPLSQQLALWHP